MTEEQFRSIFIALTGNQNGHFPWQWVLYQRLATGNFPASCNLPTGLGKTSVIALWLIALANHPDRLPRRLVYVVNRRTVVDQTTTEAEKLQINAIAAGVPKPVISTLRGQLADNREWSADPSRPAIIVGTVDMIGSRLLFSGYRIRFKSRPLHAGFLGQDALLVHDEAHLEPAFQRLIETIECEQACRERNNHLPWPKLRVMQLSATTRDATTKSENDRKLDKEQLFELTEAEKNPPEEIPEPTAGEPPINSVWRRLRAKKHLSLVSVEDDKQVLGKIVEIAAKYKDANAAVLVFVRTPDEVKTIEEQLAHTNRKVVTLTGTMRGKERDELVDKPEFRRFLKGANPGETVYLVCTSAGEVGIDISADHMVCDLSTFESMAQRLGRVHRYGEPVEHVAHIDVVYPVSFGKIDKKTGELKAEEIDKRRSKTLELLRKLPETGRQSKTGDSTYDASPRALETLRQRSDLSCKIGDAFAPLPTIVPATDILFDAWALTTIQDKLPGRPEVAPYIHGIAEERRQTTMVWRTELDLFKNDANPRSKLRAIFSKHRIRTHETLTANSYYVVKYLKEITAAKVRPDLLDTRVALIFIRNLELTTLKALIDNPGPLYADPVLVLPASFGGLDDKGMLNVPKHHDKTNKPVLPDDAAGDVPSSTLDIADAEGYEFHKDAKPRVRILIERSEDGWFASPLPGGKPLPEEWELEDSYEKSTQLIQHIRTKSGLKVRLVQPFAFDEDGDSVRSLVCLSPPPQEGNLAIEQTLEEHVGQVENEAARLATALLPNQKVANAALRFAAKWHDEGKKAKRWQRYIGGPRNGQPLGKSAEWRDPKLLAGYRHEFGSLLRLPKEEARRFFAAGAEALTDDQQKEAYELAMHLIAAHHGYARPHFDNPWDSEFTESQCEAMHIDSIQRYARLQRMYGRWGLAYLESLLRAADVAASRAVGVDPEIDDEDDTPSTDGDEA